MENTAIRCVIYARQSRTREGSESIKTQVETCRAAAERMGLEVVAVLIEPPSTSGYKNRGKSRVKFKTLLSGFGDDQWDMVMAYKTDRLSRGGGPGWAPLLDAIEAAKRDLDRSVATPSGFISEFEIGIRATMDREESKKHSSRISDNVRARAKKGLPNPGGYRPFGYEDDRITIKEDEATVLREMAKRYLNGQSLKTIAWWLNEAGFMTATGKPWYPLTVRNMLSRPRYAGFREYGSTQYKAVWQPIFDTETWDALCVMMRVREERTRGVPTARRYMLTGLLFCGACGLPLNGSTKRDNPRRPIRRTYQCRVQGDTQKKHGCGGVTRNADALEHWIRESIFAHLGSTTVLELLGSSGDDLQAIKGLLQDRDVQRARLNQFVDDYATSLLTREQFERAKTTAEAELTRIEKLLTRHTSSNAVLSMIPSGQSVEDAWASEGDEWKRALVAGLIERVVVKPGITKPYYNVDGVMARFDPTLIEIEWRSFQ